MWLSPKALKDPCLRLHTALFHRSFHSLIANTHRDQAADSYEEMESCLPRILAVERASRLIRLDDKADLVICPYLEALADNA